LCGTVVAFQLHDPGGGKIARKAKEDGDIRAAPAVDGLIFVADNANIFAGRSAGASARMHAVGILYRRREYTGRALALFPRRRGFAQQAGRAEKQVVEV